MISGRLLRVVVVVVFGATSISACDKQGATIGAYPNTTSSTTPSASPSAASASPTPTPAVSASASASASPTGSSSASPSANPSASPSANPSASPSASASASASPSAAVGPLLVSPDPINFSITSILGSTATATVSETGYTGPFTLPANDIVCGNGITDIPVTATISGSTLTVSLGILGVTGSCTITIDGSPGVSGTETVNLAVPLGTPPSSGALTFSPNPIDFNVLNAVVGNAATTTVSETGYTGAFSLPANPISCPFNLLPLTNLAATISGDVVTVTTGTLNANLLGSCDVTVDDSMGRSGAFVVNFELL